MISGLSLSGEQRVLRGVQAGLEDRLIPEVGLMEEKFGEPILAKNADEKMELCRRLNA